MPLLHCDATSNQEGLTTTGKTGEPHERLFCRTPVQVPFPVLREKKEVVAFFGVGVECIGEILYEGNVQIDGRLEGTVHTKGTLVIGDQAVVKAKIEAGTVICKGKVHGDIVAKESVEILSPGLIDGTISSPLLSVETGGMLYGRVSMGHSETPKIDPVVLFAKNFHKN